MDMDIGEVQLAPVPVGWDNNLEETSSCDEEEDQDDFEEDSESFEEDADEGQEETRAGTTPQIQINNTMTLKKVESIPGRIVGTSGGRNVILLGDKVALELKRKNERIQELEKTNQMFEEIRLELEKERDKNKALEKELNKLKREFKLNKDKENTPSLQISDSEQPPQNQVEQVGGEQEPLPKRRKIAGEKRSGSPEKLFQAPAKPAEVPPPKVLDHAIDTSREGPRLFWCICGVHYSIRHYLLNHIRHKSYKRVFQCNSCPAKFYTPRDKSKHMLTAHGLVWSGKNGCRDCGNTFKSRNHLWIHMRDTHNNGTLVHKKPEFTWTYVEAPGPREVVPPVVVTEENTLITSMLAQEVASCLVWPKKIEENAMVVVPEVADETVDEFEEFHGFMGMMDDNYWLCLCGAQYPQEIELNNHVRKMITKREKPVARAGMSVKRKGKKGAKTRGKLNRTVAF